MNIRLNKDSEASVKNIQNQIGTENNNSLTVKKSLKIVEIMFQNGILKKENGSVVYDPSKNNDLGKIYIL